MNRQWTYTLVCMTIISLCCGLYWVDLAQKLIINKMASVPMMTKNASVFSDGIRQFIGMKTALLGRTENSSNIIDATNKPANEEPAKIKVGILIPSTWRGLGKNSSTFFNTSSLLHVSLPSIFKTIEPSAYSYSIYIGIDKGDLLETLIPDIKSVSNLLVPVVINSTNFNECVNGIATRAYNDGMDYFVRTNDDVVYMQPNWTSRAIARLLSYTPPNVGVAGPRCRQGNTKILTHDMVHRTHLDIFQFYYPREFSNWWADDWITFVYKPARSSVVEEWVVVHKETHGQRYKPESYRKNRLKLMESHDKPKLNAYIAQNITQKSAQFVKQNDGSYIKVIRKL